jgi:amidase
MEDDLGAFRPDAMVTVAGAAAGPLAGLTFAAKDLYDVAGIATGAGNPDFLAGRAPATANAWSVHALLDGGATLVGKTLTDEFAFSLFGENHHYGTPLNPAAPQRVPGGSSNGSAVIVAGGLVDTALGSDTGGSVRVPASFCGIFGLRPTHGRIPLDGVVPLAPSLDTVGWFARTPDLLQRIGRVLLPGYRDAAGPTRLVVVDDALAEVEPAARPVAEAAIANIAHGFAAVEHVTIAPEDDFPGGLDGWRAACLTLLAAEAWQAHGDWITRAQPAFGPSVAERFAMCAEIDAAAVAAAQAVRERVRARVGALVDGRTVLCLPSAAGAAPYKGSDRHTLAIFRDRTLRMNCIAGLAGLPQVALPRAMVEGCPLGLGLIGPAGGDEMLLQTAIDVT